jgi:hypothetical protein
MATTSTQKMIMKKGDDQEIMNVEGDNEPKDSDNEED